MTHAGASLQTDAARAILQHGFRMPARIVCKERQCISRRVRKLRLDPLPRSDQHDGKDFPSGTSVVIAIRGWRMWATGLAWR